MNEIRQFILLLTSFLLCLLSLYGILYAEKKRLRHIYLFCLVCSVILFIGSFLINR